MKSEITEPRNVSDGAGKQLIPAPTPAAFDSGIHPFTGGNNCKRRIDPCKFPSQPLESRSILRLLLSESIVERCSLSFNTIIGTLPSFVFLLSGQCYLWREIRASCKREKSGKLINNSRKLQDEVALL
jgi:hypothetical protein